MQMNGICLPVDRRAFSLMSSNIVMQARPVEDTSTFCTRLTADASTASDFSAGKLCTNFLCVLITL
ncbi:UNVERIFIED_CONTAM: hypothetical protein NY603_34205, partial [Bacteroidetes bacterium 56_B9]